MPTAADRLNPLHVIFGEQPLIARASPESVEEDQHRGSIPRESILFGDLPEAPPGQRPSDKAALDQHRHELEQLPGTGEGFEPPITPGGW